MSHVSNSNGWNVDDQTNTVTWTPYLGALSRVKFGITLGQLPIVGACPETDFIGSSRLRFITRQNL